MKGVLSVLLLSLLIISALSDSLNPVNPNFDYPEQTKVDKGLADIPYQGEINTGYLTVNNDTKSKIFYILYPAGGAEDASITPDNDKPLILWLQGGPGCSDGTGNYNEIGPFNILNENNVLKPSLVPINWNDKYNLLFVDNPVGVGLSVSGGERPNNAMDAVKYLQIFLIRFFQLYPSLYKNDFYIFGESFAGHYIPALASLLVQNHTENGINLKGVGIDDGWTDPYVQLGSFTEYPFAVSVLDEKSRDNIYDLEIQARRAVESGDYSLAAQHFDDITNFLTSVNKGLSYYNFEVYNAPEPWYPQWLNQENTKKAYGVDTSVTYKDCVDQTYLDFYADIGTSYAGNYTFLLSQTVIPDLKVILYSGQNDIICSTSGTLAYLRKLKWDGIDNFMSAKKQILKVSNGTIAGNYKTYDRLTFATIYNAGHMVPLDQPDSARTMLEMFINNQLNTVEVVPSVQKIDK